jgi:hypothetical protein
MMMMMMMMMMTEIIEIILEKVMKMPIILIVKQKG